MECRHGHIGYCPFCVDSVDTFHRSTADLRRERVVTARNATRAAILRRGSIDAVYAAFVGPVADCECGAIGDGFRDGGHIWPCESY